MRVRCRPVLFVAALLVLLASGCLPGWMRPNRSPFGSHVPCTLPPNPTLAELVGHINHNVGLVRSWRSADATIRPKGVMGVVSLSAHLAVERPRNFRLVASSPVGNEVDFGSNDERFWFWVRQSPQKYVFTARHDRSHIAQQRMQIPFEPDWLMEALGVVPLDESRLSLLHHGGDSGLASLVAQQVSPTGAVVKKVVLVDTCHGRVLEHRLQDGAGNLIARAALSDHRPLGAAGGILPHKIFLSWPQAQTELTISLGQIELNPPHIPPQTWMLQPIPGYPLFDLGAAPGSRGTSSAGRNESHGARFVDRSKLPSGAEAGRARLTDGPPRAGDEDDTIYWNSKSATPIAPIDGRRDRRELVEPVFDPFNEFGGR